jgi:hypothetical protein
MAKTRSGVGIPIIPEDFIDSEEELNLDMMESRMQWVYCCFQNGLDSVEKEVAESTFDLYPKG